MTTSLDGDGESALGLVALCVGGLVEDVVPPGGEVVAGQVRRHHVLDLDSTMIEELIILDLESLFD